MPPSPPSIINEAFPSIIMAIDSGRTKSSGETPSINGKDVVIIGLPNSAANATAILLSGTLMPTVLRPLKALGNDVAAGSTK